MTNRGPGRAPSAPVQQSAADEEIDYEDPIDEGGIQGNGDEGEDDAEDAAIDAGEEQETGYEEDVVQQPSRAQNRLQTLARENAELRRQLTETNRQPVAPAPARAPIPMDPWPQLEPEAAFKERIALLPPDERMDARAERAEIKAELRHRQTQFITQLENDKLNFKALIATDPYARRYAKQVEDEFNDRLNKGLPLVDREILLNQMLAKDMRSPDKIKALQKRNAQAQRRVESQTVRPSSPRSDASGGGRRASQSAAEARRSRLEGQRI